MSKTGKGAAAPNAELKMLLADGKPLDATLEEDSGEQEPPVDVPDASIEVLELAEYFMAESDLVHGFAPNKLQALEDGCWKQEVFFDDPEPNGEVVELAEWFAAKADELGFAPNKSLEVLAPTLEAS